MRAQSADLVCFLTQKNHNMSLSWVPWLMRAQSADFVCFSLGMKLRARERLWRSVIGYHRKRSLGFPYVRNTLLFDFLGRWGRSRKICVFSLGTKSSARRHFRRAYSSMCWAQGQSLCAVFFSGSNSRQLTAQPGPLHSCGRTPQGAVFGASVAIFLSANSWFLLSWTRNRMSEVDFVFTLHLILLSCSRQSLCKKQEGMQSLVRTYHAVRDTKGHSVHSANSPKVRLGGVSLFCSSIPLSPCLRISMQCYCRTVVAI